MADKDKVKILARFFKTGKGEYGEGDKFLGIVVPEQRRLAKEFMGSLVTRSRTSGSLEVRLLATRLRAVLAGVQKLLLSPWHEERLTALLILVELYKKGDGKIKKQIFDFYLKNIKHINNWDLVDLSAPNIVGDYLFTLSLSKGSKEVETILLKLVRSKNLWSRRVAVLATHPFIKNQQFVEILKLAEFLLIKPFNPAQGEQKETHDLMHKAIGWMLREVGKREVRVLENFLNKFASRLPRTTLRYAIEKFPEPKRQKYLVWGKKQKMPWVYRKAFFVELRINNLFFAPALFVNVEIIEDI